MVLEGLGDIPSNFQVPTRLMAQFEAPEDADASMRGLRMCVLRMWYLGS